MTKREDHKRFKATTPGKRFFKLAGMSANIAKNVTTSKVKGVFQNKEDKRNAQEQLLSDIGQQVAQTLGEMKGAVMKVGQIASQVKDILPKEISDALETLQKDSPPMPFDVIQNQMKKELGAGPFDLFAWFDTDPFAAASIGQVHRARTHDGREVVVKIQYPGVKESCDSDLTQIKLLLKLGGLVKVKKSILDTLFDEIKKSLYEELDYIHEGQNLQLMEKLHKNEDNIIIPHLIEPLSSRCILTLTYEEGDHIEEVKEPRYSQQTINELGHLLFNTIAKQIYVWNTVHSDPHPGNFAFRPDGSIVMYDFGAVKKVDPEMCKKFQGVMSAAKARDYEKLDEALKVLGVRKPEAGSLNKHFYEEWVELFLEPFEGEYDFGHSDLHLKMVKKGQKDMFKGIEYFQPAPEMMQVDRVISGHYWNMIKLGVKADFSGLFDYFANLEIE